MAVFLSPVFFYLTWDHLPLHFVVRNLHHILYTHSAILFVAWKSYCLYLLIYLVHFPFFPLIFIGVFFLHPDQNIKLPASSKANRRNRKNYERKRKKKESAIWFCAIGIEQKFMRLGVDVIRPLCRNILIWFNPFLMHFKTMATKTTTSTHTKHTKNNIFDSFKRSNNACRNVCSHPTLDATYVRCWENLWVARKPFKQRYRTEK